MERSQRRGRGHLPSAAEVSGKVRLEDRMSKLLPFKHFW